MATTTAAAAAADAAVSSTRTSIPVVSSSNAARTIPTRTIPTAIAADSTISTVSTVAALSAAHTDAAAVRDGDGDLARTATATDSGADDVCCDRDPDARAKHTKLDLTAHHRISDFSFSFSLT